MKITDIKSFVIELAPTGENDYRYTTLGITQVFTDEGITGYGFRRTPDDVLNSQVRPGLIGKDPRNIIEILKSGAQILRFQRQRSISSTPYEKQQ